MVVIVLDIIGLVISDG